MSGPSTDQIFNAFHTLTDAEWLNILIRSLKEPVINDIQMPSFPEDQKQTRMHGHANEQALRGAFSFFSEVKAFAGACGRPVEPHRRLLDFGCGWGRMLRMFMKDVLPRNLLGAEPSPEYVMLARQHNPNLTFIQNDYLPPLALAPASFDFVMSYSVFSHLDEYSANRWVDALAALLMPGGLLMMTTQGRGFIDLCADFRSRRAEGEVFTQPWHTALSVAFEDADDARARFDRGEFLFAGAAGRMPSLYARYSEAIIPPAYVKENWGQRFHVIDHVDDPKRLAQALIVLQKPL